MKENKKLKVGAFQFSPTEDIESNLEVIKRGIELAAKQNVKLLLTQECALSGYPPVEIPSIDSIDFSLYSQALAEISTLAHKYNMHIALGLVLKDDKYTYNSVKLISPNNTKAEFYHKRALWGWDIENFRPGKELGIYTIDNIKIGIRICYEIRFPEYFRELFKNEVDLCLVSFVDIGKPEKKDKINVIQSHLVSRAVENIMYVLSANSTSQYQLAPTCLINPNGDILEKAPLNQEALITRDIEFKKHDFGQEGRFVHSKKLITK